MPCKWKAIAFPLFCWVAFAGHAISADAGLDPSKSVRQFHQDVWGTLQGLPQNTVPAIAQTNDGYLWLGTELGLVRFDGLHFTVFDKTNTPELKSNKIDALLAAGDGDLWIGAIGGGLTVLSKGTFKTFTTNNGLSGNSVLCLLQDRSGDIWIGTNGSGLDRIHNGRFTTYKTRDGLPDDEVFSLAPDLDGSIWIGTNNGLSHFANGSFRNYGARDGLPNSNIRCLEMTRSGILWIGTNGGGLSRFSDGKFRLFTTSNGLSSNAITSVREDRRGTLWIGTLGGGLTRMTGDRFNSYTSKDGLPRNDVWSVYEDRSGSLWIGTGGGGLVRLFDGNSFTAYDAADGLSNAVALPILEDHKGVIWIGTNGGGLNRFQDGRFTALTTRDGLADNSIFTICEDYEGALWIGTRKGLSRLQNGRFTTYTKEDGLPSDVAFASYADRQGSVWFGTRAGLVRWREGKFKTYTTADGLSSNVVQVIYEDRHNSLWIGTGGGGLDRYSNGHFEVFDSRRGLSNDVVLSLHEDAEGVLWIGTDGGGLNRLKNAKFTTYTTRDGLFDDAIFQILQDDSGNLLMSSDKGIFRASISELTEFANKKIHRISIVSYGMADGMKTNECNGGFQPAGWKSRDGRLWFPTMNGIVAVDPHKLSRSNSVPPAIIEQAFINGQEVRIGDDLQIPPGRGELEFHYSAPDFQSARRIVFKYKLEGFDQSWIEADGRRIVYYTNIPPGRYRFLVMPGDGDGKWSSPAAALNFRLKPHFYETFFFFGLCICGLVGLAGASHLARVRQLRVREKLLELRVTERTAELRSEISERERAELELIKAKDSAEASSRVKSEFLANMSHEIRTPMNAVMGMTELALATELSAEQREYLEIVKDSAGSLLTVINDILDFSKIEAGKLDFDPIDFNLRESMEDTIRSIAYRAHQKRLELICNVEPDIPSLVNADPVRLRQVVLNLLGNAIKFTDRGEVELHIANGPSDASGPLLHFMVRDTGIGIAQEKLKSIFDAFAQADSSTTRRFGGTGLGLAISHRLVQLMGGVIWASSEPGRGSEFHFTARFEAPISQALLAPGMAALDRGRESDELPVAAATNLNILLAEDNPGNRMVARLTLERAGFRVHEVDNGLDALNAVRENRFDAVLMDCRMPVMDGYAAARRIRQLAGPAARVPIIALTASAYKEDRERAQQAGMDDFISKPFRAHELVAKCAALGRPGLSQSAAPQAGNLETYSAEFLESLMGIFIETAPPVFGDLMDALQNENWLEAKQLAHWLQGGASRVLNPALQAQLRQIESACGDSRAISTTEIEQLRACFQSVCEHAEVWLSDRNTSRAIA
ncbi:MAG TPA: two-component regulator propeller domain-containing protein [Bryobacteraceae bacterium]|nr:two-component regulator propeller domain-containing protein [Bryobacteraceae bacterium]